MKRVDLVRHLQRCGCEVLREGGRHTVWLDRAAGTISTVPRHRVINDLLVRRICQDLRIAQP